MTKCVRPPGPGGRDPEPMFRSVRGAVLLGAVLASVACGRSSPPAEPPVDGGIESGGAQAEVVAPSSLAEIAPGDTGAILGLMRRVMTEGDAILEQAARRDTVLGAEPNREPRRLTYYTVAGEPLKLTATEPDDAGRMTGETAAWFVTGEVRVVQEPFAAFFLDGDRLVLWTDAALDPVAVPDADRMARGQAVIDTIRARLAVFGVRYP